MNILKSLYAINGLAAILFYVPQIRSAWKNKSAMHSVSLVTFGGWSFGGAVTVLYAWFFAHDLIFTAASFGGMTGAMSMFGIVAAKRITYRNRQDEAPIEESPVCDGHDVPAAREEAPLCPLRAARSRRSAAAGVQPGRRKTASEPCKYRHCA